MIEAKNILPLLGIPGATIKISNAIAESNNNFIQTLIDLCYGLPNYENMRQRILYINRNKIQKD